MATLLHHIHPWMKMSIAEAKERLERKMAQQTEQMIAKVQHRLDAFELWVLDCTSPLVDVTTLQAVVESQRADFDMILEVRVPEFESLSADPTEDTVFATLFTTSKIPPPPPREHSKRHSFREEEDSR